VTPSDASSPVLRTYIPQSKYGFVLFMTRNYIIIQAASYMNQTGISVTTYLSLLERQGNEMVELLSQDFEDEWRE
jgi:hypothetical protein